MWEVEERYEPCYSIRTTAEEEIREQNTIWWEKNVVWDLRGISQLRKFDKHLENNTNLLIFFLNGKMRIKIMVKWQVRVPDYRPCWEWGSNRKTSSAARHDRVYIRGGCGRGVGCLEVSDEGGGGLFTFRLAAAGIIPRQIISMYVLTHNPSSTCTSVRWREVYGRTRLR